MYWQRRVQGRMDMVMMMVVIINSDHNSDYKWIDDDYDYIGDDKSFAHDYHVHHLYSRK